MFSVDASAATLRIVGQIDNLSNMLPLIWIPYCFSTLTNANYGQHIELQVES